MLRAHTTVLVDQLLTAQTPSTKANALKNMAKFGVHLQRLLASVSRGHGLQPRNKSQATQLVRALHNNTLPMVFPVDGSTGYQGCLDVISTWDTSDEEDDEPKNTSLAGPKPEASEEALKTLQEESKLKQLTIQNAKIDGFQNVLDIKTIGRILVYCARPERAVTDCKLFLANKDMMLIQKIFNLVESKMAKKFRHFTLDSCVTVNKIYLPFDVFSSVLKLRKTLPVLLHDRSPKEPGTEPSKKLLVNLSEVINEDIFVENDFKLMIRMLVDRKLPVLQKKIKQAEEMRSRFKKECQESGSAGLFSRIFSKKTTSGPQNPQQRLRKSFSPQPTEVPLSMSRTRSTSDKMDEDADLPELEKSGTPFTGPARKIGLRMDAKIAAGPHRSFYEGWATKEESGCFENIIIHIHGGGFMSMTSSSHQVYLRKWAKHLKVPVFSIEYRLAPQTQFPTCVDDCVRGYIWIITYIEQVLKQPLKRVMITGDSAGGNLAFGITSWCIENGFRRPDYVSLSYPASDLNDKKFTPSFLYGTDDYFLHVGVLKSALEAYLPEPLRPTCLPTGEAGPPANGYVSPLQTSHTVLAKFPPVDIFICERDPLRDDSLRLAVTLL